MGPAPVIDQLPERPFSDRLPDMTDLGEAHREVVQREQPDRIIGFPDLLNGMAPADLAGAGKLGKLVQPVAALGGQVPAILGIEGIGSRVKDIAAHRNGQGEHGRVPCPKEVDAGGAGYAALCRHHDPDEIGIPVRFHQGDDRPDRAEREPEVPCLTSCFHPEILKDTPLDRSGQRGIRSEHLFCLAEPCHCDSELGRSLLPISIRRGRDIQRYMDITPYRLLELQGLEVRDRDVAVDRELEGPRVGHDEAIKPEQIMETAGKRLVPVLPAPREDVGVGDDPLGTHRLHLGRRDRLQVRVDDREEERCPHGPLPCLQPADPSRNIFLKDLKRDGHGIPEISALSRVPGSK